MEIRSLRSVPCEALPKELNAESAVLDGELVVLDKSGRSMFNDLLFRRGEPRFYAFDLLYCDGQEFKAGWADGSEAKAAIDDHEAGTIALL